MTWYKLHIFDQYIAFFRRSDDIDISDNLSNLPYFCAIFTIDNNHIMDWIGFCNNPSEVNRGLLLEYSYQDEWILHCVRSIEEVDIHKLPSWFLDQYEQEVVLRELME